MDENLMEVEEDIVSRILSKLPVKSLLICKSVCKDWRRLISSPHFIRLHDFNKWKENPSFIASLPFDRNRLLKFDEDTYENIPLPGSGSSGVACSKIICSFNGLICWIDHSPSGTSLMEKIYICNPATREFLLLPEPPLHQRRAQFGVAFLGHDDHDHQINDQSYYYHYYKVYAFVSNLYDNACAVYFSMTKSWKVIATPDPQPPMSSRHICINGTIYWLMSSGAVLDSYVVPPYILAIDWDQHFVRISLPICVREVPIGHEILMLDFEGCLSLIHASSVSFDLWVLKGNKSSTWVKRCSAATFPLKKDGFTLSVAARGNEILFILSLNEKGRRCLLYGVDSKKWKKVNWLDDMIKEYYPSAFAFSESLAPPM